MLHLTMERKILIGFLMLCAIGVGIWLYNESKPKPGQLLDDLGRTHVPIGTEVKYNSNPPSSGPHYEVWIKAGFYDAPRDDRNLVHSLEHGYVIISYNCTYKPQSFFPIKEAFAQDLTGQMSESTESASPSGTLPPEFNSASCQDLISQIKQIYDDKGPHKLIVVPRPNLDAKIAITAWTHLEKMNSVDKGKINEFIDGNRDKGPEKTVETP